MNHAIRVLIVDDEALSRRGLQIRLRGAHDIEVVGEAVNGRAAVEAIRRLHPDLVFLDIEMPGLSGFDVLGELPSESLPMIVFVTAYDRYAIQAFEARALDYLLKPVDEDRLHRALEHVREEIATRRAAGQRDRLMQLMADLKGASELPEATLEELAEQDAPHARRVLAVRQGKDVVCIPVAEIDWIDAAGDYMCVHAAGTTHILRGTMKSLEDRLDPACFQRVHRSTIVNLSRVRRLRAHINGEYFLDLDGGQELKLSRTYRDRLDHLIGAGRRAG